MRYNRLRDLGLSEDQIKNNLLFSADKVGDMMTVAMKPADAKAWFGAVPPDLSVITRAKSSGAGSGADYLYTYLRTFYKDDARPTGWNNMVLPNAAMPHVLWQQQGVRTARFVEEADPHEEGRKVHKFAGFEQVTPGTMSEQEFDTNVADLVAYLDWMAEPAQNTRKKLGVVVLLFLSLFAFLAWRLNASYWKDVK
jgi:ubiquinol-cytochrome c reductase cytochrome c1 subunit